MCGKLIQPLILFILIQLVPHFYTPPALTDHRYEAYQPVVVFIKKHHTLGDVYFAIKPNEPTLYIYPTLLNIQLNDQIIPEKVFKHLTYTDIINLRKMAKDLKEANCSMVKSEDGMILFYPRVSWILPQAPGVLYSMDGENPNVSGGALTVSKRPFVRIDKNWYFSRKISFYVGPRSDADIPESIFDFSADKPSEFN